MVDAVDAQLEAAEDACRTEPFDPQAHGHRARVLLAAGRHADALAAARLAVSLADSTTPSHAAKVTTPQSNDTALRRDVLTLATAIACAVNESAQAIEWAGLLRDGQRESGTAYLVDPLTMAESVAQAVDPPLVVGTRVVSLIERAEADRRRWDVHVSQESVGHRPAKVVRDARGAPVGLDTPGGLIVDGTREVPSQAFSKRGLVVFAVLFVVLLAWLCSGPSPRPDGSGGSTGGSATCTVLALDLRGDPVAADC